jgi:uncharacterized protein (TIGR04255 family)
LVNKIIKPERYQKLIETQFKGKFKKFDRIEQVQIQLQTKEQVSSITTNTLKDTGFRFADFDSQGKTTKVFQGVNEINRTFISFHTLDYTIWRQFYNDFIDVLKGFAEESKDFFVNSFSLQYIDVFNWQGKTDEFSTELFFNNSGAILPIEFFKSKFNRTYLLTIEEEVDNLTFFDRIEIKTEAKILPEISIVHNVAYKFDEEQELSSIITKESFEDMLNVAHQRNKDILGNILTQEIKTLINL